MTREIEGKEVHVELLFLCRFKTNTKPILKLDTPLRVTHASTEVMTKRSQCPCAPVCFRNYKHFSTPLSFSYSTVFELSHC